MDKTGHCLSNSLHGWIAMGLVSIALAGCGGGGSSSGPAGPAESAPNQQPQISGTPPSSVRAGSPYSFLPGFFDADGDTLTFQISNKPSWAQFNTATGALTGTPTSANVGTTLPISITVSDGLVSASLNPFSIVVQPLNSSSPGNSPPAIAGTPPANTVVGQAYSFRPTATDANGDSLTFSIQNQPTWTTFSSVTGTLAGTPTSSDVGTYSNIIISVSDGQSGASLSAFSLSVNQIATGSATISWMPPTAQTDGSALTDLAGFRIYYGKTSIALEQAVTVANPGLTTYVVQGLSAATWYFTVRAYTSDGTESGPSNVASKTIQ